jgi:hypothetical protein
MPNNVINNRIKYLKTQILPYGGAMYKILLQILNKLLNSLALTLDVLLTKVNNRTADALVVFLTLAVVIETLWLTLVLTACSFWYLLAH